MAAIAVLLQPVLSNNNEMTIQYGQEYLGKIVTLRTDAGFVKTFAGKLAFTDGERSWCSVCADLHRHISPGLVFKVRIENSKDVAGNIAKAGHIVARYFNEAKTAQQCAGLQLAVWEMLEDGGQTPDFFNGHFAVETDPATLAFAGKYYEAGNGSAGNAAYLHSAGNQSQLSSNE